MAFFLLVSYALYSISTLCAIAHVGIDISEVNIVVVNFRQIVSRRRLISGVSTITDCIMPSVNNYAVLSILTVANMVIANL